MLANSATAASNLANASRSTAAPASSATEASTRASASLPAEPPASSARRLHPRQRLTIRRRLRNLRHPRLDPRQRLRIHTAVSVSASSPTRARPSRPATRGSSAPTTAGASNRRCNASNADHRIQLRLTRRCLSTRSRSAIRCHCPRHRRHTLRDPPLLLHPRKRLTIRRRLRNLRHPRLDPRERLAIRARARELGQLLLHPGEVVAVDRRLRRARRVGT